MKLNMFGPVNSLGYGVVFRNLVSSLSDKIEITLNPVYGNYQPETELEDTLFQKLLTNIFDIESPSLLIWHQSETQIFTGKPRIAMPIFELTEFTNREKIMLNQVDYLAVMSHWGKEVLLNNNISSPDKIFVIPGGINPAIFQPNYPPNKQYFLEDTFTFLSAGKFEIRKGHKEVLQAFISAFEHSEDKVRLIAHWESPFHHRIGDNVVPTEYLVREYLIKKYGFKEESKNTYTKNNMIIQFVGRIPSALHVAELYACANVGVFPYKAEGFNLPLIEMLAMGIPCIATNYSGPTEFLRDSFSWLLDFKLVKAFDPQWFPLGIGEWAEIDMTQLIKYMIEAKENNKLREEKGRQASQFIHENFTWEHSSNFIIQMLEKIT